MANDPLKKIQEEKERLLKLANPEPEETDKDVNTEEAHEEEVKSEEEPVKTEDGFEHKYNVLLGKYNAEVPRLSNELKEIKGQIAMLSQENTELKQQLSNVTAAPAEKDEEGNVLYRSPYVTDEIRKSDAYQYYLKEYGQTQAERQAEMSVLTAKNTVKPVEEKMTKVEAKTEADTEFEMFKESLSGTCPEWQTINRNPEFIAWLQSPVPGVGKTYHKILEDAYYSMDLGRTAEIFNLFKSTKKPAPRTVPEHLESPKRGGGGAHTIIESNKGDVLRMVDMEQLYEDYRLGRYVGKEPEYQAKKAEFMKAKAEGRLV